MAIFEQSFWNTFQGNFLYNSIEGNNHLAVHWSPFLILLMPFYLFFKSAYILLILQTLGLASGGLALYLLTKNLINKKTALVISFVYLIYPSLHNINLYDFHAITFAVPLFLWFFYFFKKQKIIPASIFLFLAATTKENAILACLFVGIYLLIFSKKKLYAGAVTILSAVYFFLAAKVFMPGFGGKIERLDQYSHLGNSMGETIKNFFTTNIFFKTVFTKQKIFYIFKLLFPLSLLSLLALSFLIILIPGLAQNLLTQRASQFSGLNQYDSILIPFLFIALVFALKKIIDKKYEYFKYSKYLLLITAIISFGWFSLLSPFKTDFSIYKLTSNVKIMHKSLDEIPQNYTIAAHTNLVPHLTHHPEIYLNGFEPYLVDFVIILGDSITSPHNQEVFNKYLEQYLKTENYESLEIGQGIIC